MRVNYAHYDTPPKEHITIAYTGQIFVPPFCAFACLNFRTKGPPQFSRDAGVEPVEKPHLVPVLGYHSDDFTGSVSCLDSSITTMISTRWWWSITNNNYSLEPLNTRYIIWLIRSWIWRSFIRAIAMNLAAGRRMIRRFFLRSSCLPIPKALLPADRFNGAVDQYFIQGAVLRFGSIFTTIANFVVAMPVRLNICLSRSCWFVRSRAAGEWTVFAIDGRSRFPQTPPKEHSGTLKELTAKRKRNCRLIDTISKEQEAWPGYGIGIRRSLRKMDQVIRRNKTVKALDKAADRIDDF